RSVLCWNRKFEGFHRLKQERIRPRYIVIDLTQGADIVEDPETATVSRYDQVVIVNCQVAHRAGREVQLQRLPLLAIVERYKHSKLRSGEQQPSPSRVFLDRLEIDTHRQPVRYSLPALAAIPRAINVRLIVFKSMPVYRGVRFIHVKVGRLHHRHLAPTRHLWSANVL